MCKTQLHVVWTTYLAKADSRPLIWWYIETYGVMLVIQRCWTVVTCRNTHEKVRMQESIYVLPWASKCGEKWDWAPKRVEPLCGLKWFFFSLHFPPEITTQFKVLLINQNQKIKNHVTCAGEWFLSQLSKSICICLCVFILVIEIKEDGKHE